MRRYQTEDIDLQDLYWLGVGTSLAHLEHTCGGFRRRRRRTSLTWTFRPVLVGREDVLSAPSAHLWRLQTETETYLLDVDLQNLYWLGEDALAHLAHT